MMMCLVHHVTWNEKGCPVCVKQFEDLLKSAKKISAHWNIVMPIDEFGMSIMGHLIKELEKAISQAEDK